MNNSVKYKEMAVILKAMAHPTRLFILDMLNEDESCVSDLQAKIDADMSTVSKHLSVLRHAGIVSSRRVNNQVFYKLLYPCVLDVYKCINKIKEIKR